MLSYMNENHLENLEIWNIQSVGPVESES